MRSMEYKCDSYSWVFGLFRFAIISDAKLAREAYNEPGLSGRPDLKVFNILSGGNYGKYVLVTDGNAR